MHNFKIFNVLQHLVSIFRVNIIISTFALSKKIKDEIERQSDVYWSASFEIQALDGENAKKSSYSTSFPAMTGIVLKPNWKDFPDQRTDSDGLQKEKIG